MTTNTTSCWKVSIGTDRRTLRSCRSASKHLETASLTCAGIQEDTEVADGCRWRHEIPADSNDSDEQLRRLMLHHMTSVFAVVNWRQLQRMQLATSSMQADSWDCSWVTAEAWLNHWPGRRRRRNAGTGHDARSLLGSPLCTTKTRSVRGSDAQGFLTG
jgi:hypothetical protein